jgi:hypothetical protein
VRCGPLSCCVSALCVTCDRWRQTFSAQNFHSNRAISTSLSTRMNNSIKQHLRRTTSRLGHMPISQFLNILLLFLPKKKISLRVAISNPLKGNWPIRLSLGQTKKKKKKKNLFFEVITYRSGGRGSGANLLTAKKLFLCLCKTVNALLLPSDPFCTPSAENPTTPECCKCDWLWRVFLLSDI